MQQRPFVVEFKSPRRRQNVTTKSIWESTDLGTLMRAAEAETEELFGPMADEILQGDGVGILRDAYPVADTTAATDREPSTQPDDGFSAILSVPEELPKTAGDLASQAMSEKSFVSPKTVAVRQPRKRNPRTGYKDNGSLKEQHLAGDGLADELSELEYENRRLKGLLRQRLVEENKSLRRILERFTLGSKA